MRNSLSFEIQLKSKFANVTPPTILKQIKLKEYIIKQFRSVNLKKYLQKKSQKSVNNI